MKRRLIGLIFAVTFALFAVVLSSSSTQASLPGINGKIIFSGLSNQAYIVEPNGDDLVTLTDVRAPSYSADGTQIVYVLNDGIWKANADGSDPVKVLNGSNQDFEPTWSPDDTQIIFWSSRAGAPQIFTVDADGSNLTQLTSSGTNFYPSFSPDGSTIIFHSAGVGIRTMNADGTNIQSIAGTASSSRPRWSPDGTKIVYNQTIGLPPLWQVFVMDADGSNKTNLTNNSRHNTYPDFSPDGTKIVYYSDIQAGGEKRLYTMDVDGSNQAMVNDVALGSYATVSIGSPSWQPLTIPPTSNDPNPSVAYSGSSVVYDVVSNTTDAYGGVDPATLEITVDPTKGTATVDQVAGTITYTPHPVTAITPGFWQQLTQTISNIFVPKAAAQSTETDSFTYQICSEASDALCTQNTVTITGLPGASTNGGGDSHLAPTGESVRIIQAIAVMVLLAGASIVTYTKYRTRKKA